MNKKIMKIINQVMAWLKQDEVTGYTGKVELKHVRDGRVLNTVKINNLIVDAGLKSIVDRLGDVNSITPFEYIALGTGSTAPAGGDTSLANEVERSIATVTLDTENVANDTLQLQNTFSITSSVTVEESGVFNDASAGDLLARALTGTLELSSGDDLQITWRITAT